MKILLTTLNSKYIHSALSLKYIYNNIEDIDGVRVCIKEYTINENLQDIFADIFSDTYDLIAFSCYIWNIEYIIKLCNDIKIADNIIKILLGGPEVSYESYEFMSKFGFADFIIRDEGEVIFRKFVKAYISNKDFSNIPSFLYRINRNITENPYEAPIDNFALIKGAYDIFNEDDAFTMKLKKEDKDKLIIYRMLLDKKSTHKEKFNQIMIRLYFEMNEERLEGLVQQIYDEYGWAKEYIEKHSEHKRSLIFRPNDEKYNEKYGIKEEQGVPEENYIINTKKTINPDEEDWILKKFGG